jgi:hypothetical protein
MLSQISIIDFNLTERSNITTQKQEQRNSNKKDLNQEATVLIWDGNLLSFQVSTL